MHHTSGWPWIQSGRTWQHSETDQESLLQRIRPKWNRLHSTAGGFPCWVPAKFGATLGERRTTRSAGTTPWADTMGLSKNLGCPHGWFHPRGTWSTSTSTYCFSFALRQIRRKADKMWTALVYLQGWLRLQWSGADGNVGLWCFMLVFIYKIDLDHYITRIHRSS